MARPRDALTGSVAGPAGGAAASGGAPPDAGLPDAGLPDAGSVGGAAGVPDGLLVVRAVVAVPPGAGPAPPERGGAPGALVTPGAGAGGGAGALVLGRLVGLGSGAGAGGGAAAGAGGAMPGRAPAPKAQPSTVPARGLYEPAPDVL